MNESKKKLGRPLKRPNEGICKIVSVRLTKSQVALINANRYSIQAWIDESFRRLVEDIEYENDQGGLV